jgi:ABC-type nitrate/sulfonate/bicarbonate transport system substrate-binding protein
MLEAHGVSRRLCSFNDIIPGYVFSGVYFSNKYLAGHGNEVRAFSRGLIRAFDFIQKNEKTARGFLPKYISVSESVAQQSALRDLSGRGREPIEMLDRQRDLLVKFSLIKTKPSIQGLVDYSYLPK